jgi:hypothetical protein
LPFWENTLKKLTMKKIQYRFIDYDLNPMTETLVIGTFNPDIKENIADLVYRNVSLPQGRGRCVRKANEPVKIFFCFKVRS